MHRILSDTFRLLSVCFYMPDKIVLLEEKVCVHLKDLMSRSCPGAETHCIAMEKELLGSEEKELQTEYAALFVGPFELIAPPYGSVYLDGKHMLMGDSTMEVQRMYREAGLTLETKEVPDHIALELEFASYLTGRMEQLPNGDGENRREETVTIYNHLLQHHLTQWVPEFCQRIRTGSGSAFYCSLADCVELFIVSTGRKTQS